MSHAELRAEWRRVFGTEARSRNKDFLFRRVAHRLQELAFGGVDDETRAALEERMRNETIRIRRKLPHLPVSVRQRDPRLPEVGAVLVRDFGGKRYEVKVLKDGFEYAGAQFASLSAVAREITGTRWNGFVFFGLERTEQKGAA
ncbi:MAG: DUF2924 domain-containing protein [Myxococcales bacterium]|nr:DUF2924 domain-containing protein [Myxococcales bacterium]